MSFSVLVLAYLGPETMLPMTSVVAGVAGVVMLFGRNAFRIAASLCRGLASKVGPASKPRAQIRRIGQGPVVRAEVPEAGRVEA